jgi:hypothetical protein
LKSRVPEEGSLLYCSNLNNSRANPGGIYFISVRKLRDGSVSPFPDEVPLPRQEVGSLPRVKGTNLLFAKRSVRDNPTTGWVESHPAKLFEDPAAEGALLPAGCRAIGHDSTLRAERVRRRNSDA